MTIDELLEASTIEFLESLTLEEMGKLLDYITKNLPADIYTKTEYNENRNHDLDMTTLGTVKIVGTIKNVNNYSFDSFVTTHNFLEEDTSKISAMQFQTIPGYELEEHREEVRQLWNDVKTQVNNYFAQKRITIFKSS